MNGAETQADRILARLAGFITGVGLDSLEARQIIDRAIADDPCVAEHDIEAKAHAWMLIALA